MNARIALRFIIAALLLGALVVAASAWVGRLSASLAPASPPLQIRLDMPLDAHGRGSQRVANVELTYAVEPFPVRVGAPVRVRVSAQDLRPGSSRTITGTLETAPLEGPVDGTITEFIRGADGAFAAAAHFAAPGEYRLRARLWGVFPDETYVTLIVVRAD